MGEGVYVIGNIPLLGMWNADNAVKLYTTKNLYPCWKKATAVSSNISTPVASDDPLQFSDNMMQLGFQTSQPKMTPEAPGLMDQEKPLYLDLNELRQTHGEDFVIEYKYLVKNKENNVFWEHGKINRQIKARDLFNMYNQIRLGSSDDGILNLLIIEDQKYNNMQLE